MAIDPVQRSVLPIPSRRRTGLTTYEARDPDTRFDPIEPQENEQQAALNVRR